MELQRYKHPDIFLFGDKVISHPAMQLINLFIVYVHVSSCENLITVWQELYEMLFCWHDHHHRCRSIHRVEHHVQDSSEVESLSYHKRQVRDT